MATRAHNLGKATLLVALATALVAVAWLWLGRTPSHDADAAANVAAADRGEVLPGQQPPDQQPPAQQPPAIGPQAEAGTREAAARTPAAAATVLRGTIDAQGAPLAQARVELRAAPPQDVGFSTFLSFSDPAELRKLEKVFAPKEVLLATAVEPGGQFVFADPPPGRYEVTLDHDVLCLKEHVIAVVEPDTDQDLGRLATEAAGSVVVFVTRAQGQPVEGAELALQPDFNPMAFSDPEKLVDLAGTLREMIPLSGKTDARGMHRFGGLRRSGLFRVVAERRGLAPASADVQVADGLRRLVRIELGNAASARVTVRGEGGEPVAGARVSVVPEEAVTPDRGMFLGSDHLFGRQRATTDASGIAVVDSLIPGRATVGARAAGYLTHEQPCVLEAGSELTVTLDLDRGGAVAGKVVDERGEPIAGARVANFPQLGTSIMGFEVASFIPDTVLAAHPKKHGAETGADGTFVVHGLTVGREVHLLAVADGYAPGQLGPLEVGSRNHVLRLPALGKLTARVVHEGSGAPVDGFRAWIAKTQYLVLETHVGRFTPGENGRFELAELPQGSQTLVVEADGCTQVRKTVEITRETCDAGVIELGPASSIHGVVVDSAQQPIEGARVRLAKGGFADFEMLAKMLGQTTAVTDAAGRFRLEDVPARRVKLIAEASGFALEKSSTVRVESGKDNGPVRIVLDEGGVLVVRITDGNDNGLAGWRTQITGSATATVRFAESDALGSVRFAALAPGSYQVQAMPPSWVESMSTAVRGSMKRTAEDHDMPDMGNLLSAAMRDILQAKVTVRAGAETECRLVHEHDAAAGTERTHVEGRVTIAGAPVERGFVELLELGGAPNVQLASVKDGRFAMRGVPPGSYRVRVRAGWLSAATFHDEIVRVPRARSHEVEIALPGGRIAGRATQVDGKPAAHVVVKLYRRGDTRHYNPTVMQDVGQGLWLTDQGGRFAFDGLAAGDYEVEARDLGLLGGDGSHGGRTKVTLASGARVEDVEVRLERGAQLAVRVLRSGAPLAGATVQLLDAAGRPLEMIALALSDAEGIATLSGLPEGHYRALADGEGLAPALSESVFVKSGASAELSVALTGGVEVVLVLEGAAPPVRAGEMLVFSAWDAAGRLVRAGPVPVAAALARAKSQSGVTLGVFRPGKYRVRVESASLGVLEREHELAGEQRAVWVVDLEQRNAERR